MTGLARKNCSYNVYFDFTLIILLVKVKIAPKFGVMLLNIICQKILKVSLSYLKKLGDMCAAVNHAKIKTKGRIL